MSTDAELAGEISIDPTEFINALKRASAAFDEFSAKLEAGNGFKSVQASSAATSVAIGNMVASVASKLGELTSSVIQTGFAFDALKEQAQVAFTTLLGSASSARVFLKDLADFANKTPFEFPDLIKAAQKFTAMGLSAKQVIPTLTAVGNAVAAMGGGKETIDRVTVALTQMSAKGKVSAEEMRQLAEASIPAWQILAEKLGKTIPETMKLSEKGAIDATTAINALVEGMQSRFGGMMEQQALTFNGLVSTLHDTATQMAGEIFEPLFAASKDVLGKIVGGLPEFQRQFNQAWKDIVAEVGNSLSELKPIVSAALSDVKSLWTNDHNEIMNITKTAWNLIYAGFIKPAVDGISRLIASASQALAGNWEAAMNRLVGSTENAGGRILSIVARWVQALARVSGLITGISGVANFAVQNGGASNAVDSFWKDATNKLRDKSRAAEDAAYAAGKRINSALGSGLKGKKGANEAEKAMRELLAGVNEYIAASGNGAKITEKAWLSTTESVRQNMEKQKDAFFANRDATAQLVLELKGGLLSTYPQLAAALVDYINKMKEAQAITAQAANVKLFDFIQPSKTMAADLKRAEKDLEDSNKKIQKMNDDAAKEAEKAAKKIHDAMLQQFEDLSRKLPDSWNIIIDGIVNGSGKVGDAVYEMSVKIKGWAGDIIGVVDTLPGHFGDAARKVLDTVDQWVKFADKVLAVLNRMDSSIPGSIGGIVEKITGMFKKTTKDAEVWSEDIWQELKDMSANTAPIFDEWGDEISTSINGTFGKIQTQAKTGMTGFLNTIKGALGFAGGLFASFSVGLGVANSTGSKTKGAIMGGISGALSGAATGAAWGAAGGPIGAGIGAAIGAGVGIIGGLFGGGKSKEQKAAEEAAKQKAGLDMQKMAADILSAQMDGLKKGMEVLESLADFTTIPRKNIKRFMNEMELLLSMFADMAGRFKAESIEASKALAEAMGPAIDTIAGALNVFAVLPSFIPVASKILDEFFASFSSLITKFGAMAETIPNSLQKQAKKFSDRMMPAVELISATVEALFGDRDNKKGVIDAKAIDASMFDALGEGINLIVAKMTAIAATVDNSLLKVTQRFSEKALPIFQLIQGVVETFDKFKDLKVPSTELLDGVLDFARTMIEKVSAMAATLNVEFLGRSEQIAARAGGILTFVSGFMEGLGALASYKGVEDAVLNAITSDLEKVLAWGSNLLTLAESGIGKFESLQSAISKMASAIKGSVSGISGLSASLTSSSGIASSLQRDGGSLLSYGRGASQPSPTIVQDSRSYTFQITMSLKDLEELATTPDRLERIERMVNAQGSRTGQRAQGLSAY